MANFFDDEADDDDHVPSHGIYGEENQEESEFTDVPQAGPSRARVNGRGGGGNRSPSAAASIAYRHNNSRSPSLDLPPPLRAQHATINNTKGKARANGVENRQHARATSTLSMDLDGGAAGGRRGGAPSRRRAGGFLQDDDEGDVVVDQDEDADVDDGGNQESDVQHLMRLYMDERQAPELLPYPEELVNTLMQNLEAQTEAASVLLSSGATARQEEHERLLLVQMEIERVRWLLRSYLRSRTYKIEKQAQYLLKTPLAKNKMSEIEAGYAERYLALVHRHFTNAVTGNIPERLGRLDEDEMVIRPELDQAVFAKARKSCPPIELPDGQQLEMRQGEIHLVRYRSIRRLLRDGDVRLV